MIQKTRKKPRLNRICRYCGKKYLPTGKFQKICIDCLFQVQRTNGLNAHSFKTK